MIINVRKMEPSGYSVQVDKSTVVIHKEQDLKQLPVGTLLRIYNAANPTLLVNKFSDHDTACRRTFVHLAKAATMPLSTKDTAAPATKAPATAMGKVVSALAKDAAAKAPAKATKAPEAKAPAKAPEAKAPKVVKEKAPIKKNDLGMRGEGVIYTVRKFCLGKFRTIDEIAEHLAKTFPDKKADAMRTTAIVNVSPTKKIENGSWEKSKEKGKPTTYKFNFKG